MSNFMAWAKALKRDVMTLWFALKHPQTPWHTRPYACFYPSVNQCHARMLGGTSIKSHGLRAPRT
jgi:hypothetical protein